MLGGGSSQASSRAPARPSTGRLSLDHRQRQAGSPRDTGRVGRDLALALQCLCLALAGVMSFGKPCVAWQHMDRKSHVNKYLASQPYLQLEAVGRRVQFPDRTGLTAGLRYRFTSPVRPVTGRNR